MEYRCKSCGAVLTPGAGGGMPANCTYCGAPQQPAQSAPVNPYAASSGPYGTPAQAYGAPPQGFGPPAGGYGAPPQGFGAPDGGFGAMNQGLTRPPGTGAGCAIAGVAVVLAVAGAIVALVVVTRARPGAPGATSSGGLPISQLATLTLKQTPEAMAKITGVTATNQPGGDTEMELKLSGGTWNRLNLSWDPADPSHAKEAYFYADAPPQNDAAIRAKLAASFGRRLDKDGNFNFGDGFFGYGSDSAHCESSPRSGSEVHAHWKEEVDALWDVMRADVLGLSVPIADAESRDWLGRGYTLASLGAVDPAIDVDHAAAAMLAAFPAVATRVSGGLENTIAIDHPWYGYAEVKWADEKGGTLEEVYLYPPPQNEQKFTSQTDIEACVQGALGGKSKRYDGDHLKGDWSTEWSPPAGGEVRVYEHLVHVTLYSHFQPKKMPRAEWQKLWTALDACGRHK